MLKPTLTRSLALLLASATAFFTFSQTLPHQAVAQSSPPGKPDVPYTESHGALLPDWEGITFRSIPPVKQSGSLNLADLTKVLGYDPSRYWKAGDNLTSILMLGDLAEATNLPTRSLKSILDSAGLSTNSLTLADFGVVNQQTIQTLVDAVPALGDLSLGDLTPLYDLVEQELGGDVARNLSDSAFGNLIKDDLLADLPLNALNLGEYTLNTIPGLLKTPLNQFSQWNETLISQIPGLADLPFANFFTDLGTSGVFALVDIVFGEKEARRLNTITGSNKVGFNYACNQTHCAHIELAAPDGLGATFLKGKQWISGKSQWVPGGSGCLAGQEPTGRHPFGQGFKVVLTDTNEASGLAEFGIYFRFSLFCGTSPYIIGPFPWISQHEKDIIFLGLF